MSMLKIHRNAQAIDGLKLLWEKLQGETRAANFTQSWHWYRVVARLVADRYEPVVLEARHTSGPVGLLPLLADRRRGRWISPQLMFGFGTAAPIGSQPTATWLIIGRHLRDQLPAQLQWHLGPFPHGTGAASRLGTAFEQLVIPQVAERRWQTSEIDLQQTGLRWRDPQASPLAKAASADGWQVSLSQPCWNGGEGVDWQGFQLITPLIPADRIQLGNRRLGPGLSAAQLEHVYGELSSAGLAHLVVHQQRGVADFGLIVFGDRHDSIAIPVGKATDESLHESFCRLRASGFARTTLLGPDRRTPPWTTTPRSQYAYWYASQWNTQIALKQLWHRMVPAGELKTAP